MTAFDELLADYDRLRSGDAECNTKDRDRLVKRVAAEREELVELLKQLEWMRLEEPLSDNEGSSFPRCPECERENFRGHKEGCAIAAVLEKHKGKP